MAKAEVIAADEFDPSAVPMYPLLRAEIRDTDSGEYVGLVDDQIVGQDLDLEPVRSAIIAASARTAGRRLGSLTAIRVRGQAPDGGIFSMVVTAAGDVYDTTDTTDLSSGAQSSTTVGRTGRRRRKPGIQTPSPDGAKRFRFHPVMLVIVGFPVAMLCFFGWLAFRPDSAPATVAIPGQQQLPVVAPQGYSPVARWAVRIGTASGAVTGGVAADSQRVYATTGSGDQISAYSARDGVQAWSIGLGSPLTSGPTLTTVDGVPVVAAATSTRLVTLNPATGLEVGSWTFDSAVGSRVRITTTGPIVTGQSNLAQIIVGGQLTMRIMPAGALPVGPGPGGSLIAVTRDRVYASLSTTLSGAGRAIMTGGTGTMSVAGWTGDRLVLAYQASSATSNGVQLAGYAAPTDATGAWRRLWVSDVLTSTALGGGTGNALPLVTGPAGIWGVYGATAITLATGSSTALGQWSTVAVGDRIGFGAGATQVLTAGPSGIVARSDPEPASVQVIAPQAVSGSDAYLVTGGGGTTAWLYALTPAAASAAPSITAAPTGPGGAR